MKILISEDDPASKRLLETILKTNGHEVVGFTDGRQALDYFQEDDVSVIISDWMMPVLDGVEFCRQVRATQKQLYTYFILLTAKSDRNSYIEAMNSGVDDFLAKPLDSTQLMLRLHVAERIRDFQNELQTLKRLMPICMYCKSIRDDAGYWQEVELFFKENDGIDFTHGVCPACYEKIMAQQKAAKEPAAAANPGA